MIRANTNLLTVYDQMSPEERVAAVLLLDEDDDMLPSQQTNSHPAWQGRLNLEERYAEDVAYRWFRSPRSERANALHSAEYLRR